MASERSRAREGGGGGDVLPWHAPGAKRRCCGFPASEITMREFMEKLNPSDLQQVQNMCKKYLPNAPQLSISSGAPKYRFSFRNKLPDTIYTDRKISVENNMVEIVILDASNNIVKNGPLASTEVVVVVLDGDFNVDKLKHWSMEDFMDHIVDPRKDKRPLLIGNLDIKLHDGIGYISDVKFSDNSSWMKNKKFRLGVMQSTGIEMVEEVQAGVSNPFRVKDRHGESNRKDFPPSINDEVYRLKGISQNGTFHKKLLQHGIKTVANFLSYYNDNPEKLHGILQMSKTTWEKALSHALESKASNIFNGLVNPLSYQDSLTVTRQHSLQTSGTDVDRFLCWQDCEPSISGMFTNAQSLPASNFSFPSTNSYKPVQIEEGLLAEQLDFSWEVLMNGEGSDHVPKKFDGVSLSPPCLWSLLICVTRWKIAASKTRKSKLLAHISLEEHADAPGCFEPNWEGLEQLVPYSPL